MTLFQAKKAARRIIAFSNGQEVPEYPTKHTLISDGKLLAGYLLDLLSTPEKIDALMLADNILNQDKGVV